MIRAPWALGTAALVAAAIAANWLTPTELPAQRPALAGSAASGGLWISDSQLDEGRRLLVIVDPATRHAAIYHVDSAAGGLALKSTRDLTWDLMMGDFNAREPKPAALRKMLQGGSPAAESPR